MTRCTLCAALLAGTVHSIARRSAESSLGNQRDSVGWEDVVLAAKRCLALLRAVACASRWPFAGWRRCRSQSTMSAHSLTGVWCPRPRLCGLNVLRHDTLNDHRVCGKRQWCLCGRESSWLASETLASSIHVQTIQISKMIVACCTLLSKHSNSAANLSGVQR